jgi:exo-poly-alpha-galacturonosidase
MKILPRFAWALLLLPVCAWAGELPAGAIAGPAASGRFVAPPLARTASTVLLLWGRFTAMPAASYEVLCDGAVLAATPALSYTATHLAAGRTYRFAIRALDAGQHPLGETGKLSAATKAAGVVLNVRERGAKGDGLAEDTAVIQQAIDACPAGGTVLVPAGLYSVDHLELKRDLTLDLAPGATLRFLGRGVGHYDAHDVVLPGPDGPVSVSVGALITGVHTDHVTITGGGTIQANGETWWQHASDYRPKVFEVVGARDLFVQGVAVEDPPSWDVHPLDDDGVVFANVTFNRRALAHSINADGLDLDSCRDVLVVGCSFGNQDDSIAIKCGKLTPTQARRQRPSADIVVRDCLFDGRLGPSSHPLGIAIGSEICGGVARVLVQDCAFRDVASIMNIKANRDRRYARVEDVLVQDCSYANTVFGDEPWNHGPITLDLFYYGRTEDPNAPHPPSPDTPFFHRLHFRNLTIDNPRGYAIYITGLTERPIEDVTFDHVTAHSKLGLFARNIAGLTLQAVDLTPQSGPAFVWGTNVTQLHVQP